MQKHHDTEFECIMDFHQMSCLLIDGQKPN